LQAVAGALRWPGAQALVGAQVLGQVVAAAWLAWSARGVLAGLWRPAGPARRRVGRRRWLRVARRLVRRYRQFPLVNAPHAFVNALQDTLALALVLALAGPVAAGLFGLMVRVVMAPTSLIGGALSEMLLGRAAATWREGGDVLPMLRRAVWLLGACALPSAMVLAWAGPWLFATVLGPAWREAGEWARWLAPCMAGRMIVGPLTVLPMIFQRQATAFAFSLCGNALYVLGLGLGLLAVPAWGVSDALRWACGLVSLLMGAYFAVYLAWLWRLAAARRAASVGAA
jgi:O-antigen/teichoic acid export membrane protein